MRVFTNVKHQNNTKMEKRVILEKLEEFGFALEEIPEFGYVFNYEGINFLYAPDDDDVNFLRFSVPNIFDVTEDNRTLIFDIINDTNLKIKYGKVCAYGYNVWATYEHRIFNNDNIEEVIEHCLLVLQATVVLFHRLVEGDDIQQICDSDNDTENEEVA